MGKVLNFDFGKEFSDKIMRIYTPMHSSMTSLEKHLKEYREKFENEYNAKPWYSKLLLSSNQYISTHNEIIIKIVDNFKRDIQKEIEMKPYEDKLWTDCVKYVKGIHDDIDKKENMAYGTSIGVGTAVGTGGLTAGMPNGGGGESENTPLWYPPLKIWCVNTPPCIFQFSNRRHLTYQNCSKT